MAESSQPHVSRLPEVPHAHRIECVYLTCFRPEFSVLAIILHYSAIRMHRAETLEEADFLLTVTGSTVLLSDIAFLDGSWQDALRMAGDVHPLVASTIVADPADLPSLAGACDLGACGTLLKPIDSGPAIQLIRVLHEAVCDRASVLRDDSLGTALLARPSVHCR
jgi:DNA-binding NtrC family response regulator